MCVLNSDPLHWVENTDWLVVSRRVSESQLSFEWVLPGCVQRALSLFETPQGA